MDRTFTGIWKMWSTDFMPIGTKLAKICTLVIFYFFLNILSQSKHIKNMKRFKIQEDFHYYLQANQVAE